MVNHSRGCTELEGIREEMMIRKVKSTCILLLLLVLANCANQNMACLEKGEGVTFEKYTVNIPGGHPDYDYHDPSSYWIPLGLSVSSDKDMILEIRGKVNTCPSFENRDAHDVRNIEVPSSYCMDGNSAVPLSPSETGCESRGGISTTVYTDTHMTIRKGDFVKFSLDPIEITIDDCNNLPAGVTKYQDGELASVDGSPLSWEQICKYGAFASYSGKAINIGPFEGTKHRVISNDGFGPESNRSARVTWLTDFPFVTDTIGNAGWINGGALVDLRKVGPSVKEYAGMQYTTSDVTPSIRQYYIDASLGTICRDRPEELLKYTAHEINSTCGRIQAWNYNGDYQNGTVVGALATANNEITQMVSSGAATAEDIKLDKIVGLVAKVGGSGTFVGHTDIEGLQCLPSNTSGACYDPSINAPYLEVGKNYQVIEGVDGVSMPLMMAVSGNPGYKMGGYRVRVTKECYYKEGHNLYVYVSEDGQAPNFLPGEVGENGDRAYEMIGGTRKNKIRLNIDTPEKSGAIFLGLKGAATTSVADGRMHGTRHNQYVVEVRKPIETIHVSAIITWLRDWMLDAFYGDVAPSLSESVERNVTILVNETGAYTSYEKALKEWKKLDKNGLSHVLSSLVIRANRNVQVALSNQSNSEIRLDRRDREKVTTNSSGSIVRANASIDDLISSESLIHGYTTSLSASHVYTIKKRNSSGGWAKVCDIDTIAMNRVPGKITVQPDNSCVKDFSVEPLTTNVVNFGNINVDEMANDIYNGLRAPKDHALRGTRGGGIIRGMFESFLNSDTIKSVRALLVLYVAVTSILYISGLVKTPQFDLIVRFAKIFIVVKVLTPDAWSFFNRHLFSGIYLGTQELVGIIGASEEGNEDFVFLDRTFGLLLMKETWLKIASLFFVTPLGGLILYILVVEIFWEIFTAGILALTMYFLSMIAVAFLISISPLFISAVLFQRTKGLFDGWLKALINYGLQPVFLFGFITVISEIAITFSHQVFDFSVCARCLLELTIAFVKLCLLAGIVPFSHTNAGDYGPEGQGAGDVGGLGLPFDIFPLFSLWVIAQSMSKFVHFAQLLSQALTNSMGGVEGAAPGPGNAGSGARKAYDDMKSVFGKDAMSEQRLKGAKDQYANRSNKSITDFLPKFLRDDDGEYKKWDKISKEGLNAAIRGESLHSALSKYDTPENASPGASSAPTTTSPQPSGGIDGKPGEIAKDDAPPAQDPYAQYDDNTRKELTQLDNQMNNDLKDVWKDYDANADQYSRMQGDMDDYEKQLDDVNVDLDYAQLYGEENSGQISDLENKRSDLQSKMDNLKTDLDQKTNEMNTMKDEAVKREAEIKDNHKQATDDVKSKSSSSDDSK